MNHPTMVCISMMVFMEFKSAMSMDKRTLHSNKHLQCITLHSKTLSWGMKSHNFVQGCIMQIVHCFGVDGKYMVLNSMMNDAHKIQ